MKLKKATQHVQNILKGFNLEKRTDNGIIELSDGKVAVSIWDHFGESEASVAVAGTTCLEDEIGYWGNNALVDYLSTKHTYKLPKIGAQFISPVTPVYHFGVYNVKEEALMFFGNIARDYLTIVRALDSTIRKGLLEYDSQMRRSFDATKELKRRLKEEEKQREKYHSEIQNLLGR